MKFSNNPKGIYIGSYGGKTVKIIDKSKIKNVDFLIGDAGDGWNISEDFTNVVQIGYELKIPVLAIYHVSTEQYQNIGMNGALPEPKDDWNIKNLARMINMNVQFKNEGTELLFNMDGKATGNHRKVASIILDYTNPKDRMTGKVTTAGWMRKISDKLNTEIFTAFGLNQFYYITDSLINTYPAGNIDVAQWLASLDGIITWKTATPTNTATVAGSWDNFPIPADDYIVPSLYNKTYFFKYANTKYTMAGIDGTVPMFMYNGTFEQFYKDIGYAPSGDPVIIPVDPDPIPTTIDLTEVNKSVLLLQAALDNLKLSIEKLR